MKKSNNLVKNKGNNELKTDKLVKSKVKYLLTY